MQTAYPHSPAGGAYHPTSQDSSIQPLPAAVYLPNEMQINIVAAQPPREFRVPETEQELCDYVIERLAYLRKNGNCGPHLSSKECPNDNDSPLQSHCNTSRSNGVDCCHPTSSTCDKEDVERQSLSCSVVEHCCTTAAATTKALLEEYSSKASEANAELTPTSKGKSETSASRRISTEYPQIINEAAAATCTKTESPVVLTTVSGVWTCDKLTEKYQPGLTLSCSSSSQKDSKSISVNADKDDRGGDEGLKLVEMDDVEGMIKNCKDSRTPRVITADQDANIRKQKASGNQQHCPVSSKEATAHSNSSADTILINDAITANQNKQPVYDQSSCKNIGKDVSYVCSEVSRVNPKYAECTPLSGRVYKDTPSVAALKEPQYEDISDPEDMSELDMQLPEHDDDHNFPLHLEDPEYEDISEDENPPIQNVDVEMPSFPRDEPKVKPSGHVQIQIKSILDEELIPVKQLTPETGDDDTECVSGAICDHVDHAECRCADGSCSPSSDLKDEDETDDEMDDDWDIIPLIILEVKLESSEDEADPVDVLSDVGERVDIKGERVDVKGERVDVKGERVDVKSERVDVKGERVDVKGERVDVKGERVDIKGERVDIKGERLSLLCQLHQPPPVQVSASAFSQIEVFDTCESFQQAKAVKLGKCPQNHVSGESLPERDPKSHHSRRDSYSESEDSCETDDSCNYSPVVEERNHLTVSMKLLLNRRRNSSQSFVSSSDTNDWESEKDNVDDEATNLQNIPARSRKNTCKKEDDIILISDTEDECDQVCTNNTRQKRRGFLENGVGAAAPCSPQKRHSSETVASESVNSNLLIRELHDVTQQNVSDDESVIVIDSDKEDDSIQNYKAKRKREFSSEWTGADKDPFVKQPRTPVHTEYETAKGQLKECRQSAGSVCVQQNQTNAQMNASKRFYDSDHVVTTDKIVKKKAKTKRRTLSSEPGDSDSDFINVQKSPHVSNNKSLKSQSSKDSSEKQPQSGTDREEDTTVGHHPLIPRLFIHSFPQENRPLKLCEQSIAKRRDKEAAKKKQTSTRNNLDSCKTKTQLFHGETQGKFGGIHISNPKPAADERHHVTPLSKSEESSSPRRRSPSFKPQRPDSNISSTSSHSYIPTKGSSAMTQVTNKWRETYYSTRKDKKTSVVMEEGSRSKNNQDVPREAKPRRSRRYRKPRRRNSSQESATPLMKRTRVEARELTKARNRDASWEQPGHRVGEGYKWRK